MITDRNQEAITVGNKEQINIIISEIENNEWYSNVIYYFNNLAFHDHLVEHKRRALRLKSMKYHLTEEGIKWRNLDGVILRCVNKEEANKLMIDLHSRHCGGHFATHTTSHKILRA
jgi:hypothetical protein